MSISRDRYLIQNNIRDSLHKLREDLNTELSDIGQRTTKLDWWKKEARNWLRWDNDRGASFNLFAEEIRGNMLNLTDSKTEVYRNYLRQFYRNDILPTCRITNNQLNEAEADLDAIKKVEPNQAALGRPVMATPSWNGPRARQIASNIYNAQLEQWRKVSNGTKVEELYKTWVEKFSQLSEYRELLLRLQTDLKSIVETVYDALPDLKGQDSAALGESTDTLPPKAHSNRESISLSHPQIAILHHIVKHPITKNNANDIARKFHQTSGQKLEATYRDLTSELTRTAKGKFRVEDYLKISELIPEEHKNQYYKELRDARASNGKLREE